MAGEKFDLVVIGAGVGGYVAAIRAAQLGMKVACVDKRASLGGTCLNVGCIPSKALLHSSLKYEQTQHHLEEHGIRITGRVEVDLPTFIKRKDKVVEDLTKGVAYLFRKNKVTFLQGNAQLVQPGEITVTDARNHTTKYNASRILIATGSEVTTLPGIDIDEKRVISSTGALSLEEIPKHLVVIGGGYIGLELGSVWRRLGAQVTVIEYMDSIVPSMDKETGTALFKSLKSQGMDFRLSTKVQKVEKNARMLKVHLESVKEGVPETLECNVVLCCTGRRPYTDNLGIDALGIQKDERGYISVNQNFETSIPGIYAVGDVIQGPMLAHKAEEEGMAVAEYMAGQKPHVNYKVIPSVVYTYPEAASVGQTEEELKKANLSYRVGKFPFSANSRARPNGETEGFVKILADAKTDEVLGVHIIHAEAGTLIAEAALAMEFRASSEDIARTCHAHPTLNEALKEASLNVFDRAIHI